MFFTSESTPHFTKTGNTDGIETYELRPSTNQLVRPQYEFIYDDNNEKLVNFLSNLVIFSLNYLRKN